MAGNPNNYFLGTTRSSARPCESCERPVKVDEDNPQVFGSGRFCSEICSRLRTPEKHWQWKNENPEDYEVWSKWKTELEEKKVSMPGTPGNNDVILPIG